MSAQHLVKIRKKLLGKDLAKDMETPFMIVTGTCSKMSYKDSQKLLGFNEINDAQVKIVGKQMC